MAQTTITGTVTGINDITVTGWPCKAYTLATADGTAIDVLVMQVQTGNTVAPGPEVGQTVTATGVLRTDGYLKAKPRRDDNDVLRYFA